MTGARKVALVAGVVRLASGVSFLVAPEKASQAWGGSGDPGASESLLLRSMGYRDALIGGLLVGSVLRGRAVGGWLLASAGADAADLVGGLANHSRMSSAQRVRGIGGAAVGIAVGVVGAFAAWRSR